MASIIKKKKKNQFYYYLVESARVNGKQESLIKNIWDVQKTLPRLLKVNPI
ncbi:hypothetical protein P378_12120 [Desulforamulus profundi]|uniref:Uncharacterized protein n=1 Tax=Desulforamulus profundi TaxID=1383067 RepID=A0A2C6MEI6_9FIRM|nr:hypothetical protein [Desulforamulus profundi]PHJ38045.1 hypothetical protein P378_12120 [Desulforamulus profundi]